MDYVISSLLTDFYKTSHMRQYPKGTQHVYSTWTPRASRIDGIDQVVAFGFQSFVQGYLIEHFKKNFFSRPKADVVAEYARYIKHTLFIAEPETQHIADLHDLGYLPVRISAVPEGTLVPLRCPMLTIENTNPNFFWVTNYLETLMSQELWLPSTAATIALQYRRILDLYASQTSDIPDFVNWQGHDFSMRGMAGLEASMLSGSGHLLSFNGTDTIPAIMFLEKFYGANIEKELVGGSVPATEHSVMCAYGRDEFESYKRIITEVYPNGIVSIVSDTWDLWKVLTDVVAKLKTEILARDGKVVVRPDCYDSETQTLTPRGWVLFKDLKKTDLVAQVKADGHYEFVKPLKYVAQKYEGDMYSFKDQKGKLDLLVTPNHRMIFKRNGNLIIQEASEATPGGWTKSISRSAMAPDRQRHLTDLERLKIAFQADGSYVTSMKTSIRFSFSKKRKIERMVALLERIGYFYAIYDLADDRKEIHIKCDATAFVKDLSWVDTADLDVTWCAEFIEELSYWDACRRSETRFKFDTTVEKVADVAELVAISAGYGVLRSHYNEDRKAHFSAVHTLHIRKDNRLGGQAITKTKVKNYTGMVYCVQVPTGMLLVKRNRGVAVCGNSGDPVKIICGDPDASRPEAKKGVIEILWDIFGGTINSKGFKQLDPHIGAIYGDAITMDRAMQICQQLKDKGFASTNIVFGIGSYTYQYNTRDTFGFALKSTWCMINDEEIQIYKDPATDNGVKKSQKGRVQVHVDKQDRISGYVDRLFLDEDNWRQNFLRTIFCDGTAYNTQTLSEIRERLKHQ